MKGTRGKEEDEIFMTEMLREFDFISPRTNLVNVKINGEKLVLQNEAGNQLATFNAAYF